MQGEGTDLAALYRQTKAQIDAEPYPDGDRVFVLAIVRMSIAKSAVLQATQGARNVHDDILCPCCGGGRLRYTVQHNGHVWAHCTTPDCVSFLE